MIQQHTRIFAMVFVMSAVALVPLSALAQDGRLSLAERVARMEQQLQGQQGGATLEQINRISDLQNEVRDLRGMAEQQQFEIENLKKKARDQYVDLDSRVSRMRRDDPAAASEDNSDTLDSPQQGFQDVAPDRGDDAFAEAPTARDRRPASDAIELAPSTPGGGMPDATEKSEYDAARAQLDAGQYASAARSFAEFVRVHPDSDLTANALYWLGESYYVTQNFQTALDTFRDLVARYPDSNKVADAMLKIGYCHFELQQFDDAEVALNEVIQMYPDTTVARLAQGRLRALRTDRGAR